jgi:Na+/proline symporter
MKAVIWTDITQTCGMFIGIISSIIFGGTIYSTVVIYFFTKHKHKDLYVKTYKIKK